MAVCPQCKRENPVESAYCPACGAPMTEEGVRRQRMETINRLNVGLMGMKWYKFLMYFSLPASLIVNAVGLFDNIGSLSEFDLGNLSGSLVSLAKTELMGAVVLGIVMLVLLAVAEWGLVKRKWLGVKALLASYALNGLFALVMTVLVFAAKGSATTYEAVVFNNIVSQYLGQAVGSVVMFCLNRVYFNKRKPLFLPDEV